MTPACVADVGGGTRVRRGHLIVFACLLGASLLLFAPADLAATTRFIGATTADTSQHAWFLRWLPYALSAHVNPLFSDRVIEPGGVNLMWNTWMPLPALVLSPVTLLAGPVAAFDSAVSLGAALSAFSMYLAASRFLHRRAAAIAAGAAYGFSPFILDHAYAGHSNLVMAFVPPLLLLSLDTVLVRQDVRVRGAGLRLGLLLLVQFFITEELLASEAVAAVVGVACLAVVGRREVATHWRYAAGAVGWALLLVVPVLAYPLWFQFFGPSVPRGLIGDKNFFVTDLLNTFLPTASQGFEPGFAHAVAQHYAGNSGEWDGYIGLPMLAVVGWTVWRHRDRALVRVSAVGAVVLLMVSFGSSLRVGGVDTHIPMPGAILAHLPVLDNLLPARFALYVALLTALLLGVFLDELTPTPTGRRVLLLAGVFLVAADLPPLPFPTRPATTPAFFTASPTPYPSGSALLVIPFAHDFYTADAMRWQAESGMSFRMPEGYIINRLPSGRSEQGPPPSTTESVLDGIAAGTLTDAEVTSAQRQSIAGELRQWHIDGVVLVDGTAHADVMRALLAGISTATGRGVDELGVTYWDLDDAGAPAPAH